MNKIEEAIDNLRDQKPLILNLTNLVTMDFVANCLLAIGAAPIMCVYEDELEELVKLSSVIYINIGTLDTGFIHLTQKAIQFATEYKKSIVLDPVGAGATAIRTKISGDIAPFSTIMRGNASEIMALGNTSFIAKGVEAVHTTEDATKIADMLAIDAKTIVAVSGAIDYITDGTRSKKISFGSPIMKNVTGMGCAMTAVIAAMLTVKEHPFEASVIGSQYFALCGELASLNCKHPGSFKSAFIDELHRANFDLMRKLYDR